MCAGKLGPGALTIAYPLRKGDLAKLTFYEGGAGGYLVRRAGPEALAVIAWEQTDGACPLPNGDLGVCPPSETRVVKLHVPAHVKVHEAIVEIEPDGTRHPIDCAM